MPVDKWAIGVAFLLIIAIAVLMPTPKAGQDYCDTLSGDASETLAAAQAHWCVSNCYYNVTKTPDGKYPPCKDHGYTYNKTAFLAGLERLT